MNRKELNVVYIGPQSFPVGGATTKRRRYMVDYMNNHHIQSHYLVCDFKRREECLNATYGVYGLCDYYDITPLAENKKYLDFYVAGKKHLKSWFETEKQNVLIFGTIVSLFEYPFYVYAKKDWDKLVNQLNTLPFTKKDARTFIRSFFSGATECEFDRQGRTCIASPLIVYAGLSKECVIIGANDRIEIWGLTEWNNFLAQNEEKLSDIAENLFGDV